MGLLFTIANPKGLYLKLPYVKQPWQNSPTKINLKCSGQTLETTRGTHFEINEFLIIIIIINIIIIIFNIYIAHFS